MTVSRGDVEPLHLGKQSRAGNADFFGRAEPIPVIFLQCIENQFALVLLDT